MQNKFCKKCKKLLPITEFYKSQLGKWGVRAKCKNCMKEENINNYSNNHSYIYSPHFIYYKIKHNAIKTKREFSLKEDDFNNWYNSQEQKCDYCGRNLEQIRADLKETDRNKGRFSIDRKDNSKSYELDNIVLACGRCNIIKSDYFTYEQMKRLAKSIYKIK
jgi:hypothetical protein